MKLVELAIRNARLTLSVLIFLIFSGGLAYYTIPKEAEPDIQMTLASFSMPKTRCSWITSRSIAFLFRSRSRQRRAAAP